MLKEQYFPAFSRHQKAKSETSMPVNEVEEWLNEFEHKRSENLPNGGIIKATASVTNMGGLLKNKELKEARAKAKRDHAQALKNIKEQQALDAIAIKKQVKIWAAEKEASSAVNRKTKNKIAIKKTTRIKPLSAIKPKKASTIKMDARRKKITKILTLGQAIPSIDLRNKSKKSQSLYNELARDLTQIKKDTGLKIVRINSIKDLTSSFIVDNFKRYQPLQKIKASCITSDNKDFLAAIKSGQLVEATCFDNTASSVSGWITTLARKQGMSIYTVLETNKRLIGWILIDKQ